MFPFPMSALLNMLCPSWLENATRPLGSGSRCHDFSPMCLFTYGVVGSNVRKYRTKSERSVTFIVRNEWWLVAVLRLYMFQRSNGHSVQGQHTLRPKCAHLLHCFRQVFSCVCPPAKSPLWQWCVLQRVLHPCSPAKRWAAARYLHDRLVAVSDVSATRTRSRIRQCTSWQKQAPCDLFNTRQITRGSPAR